MIYLGLALIVALSLLLAYGKRKARDGSNAAAVAGLSAAQAQAEYDACRARIAALLGAVASPDRLAAPGAALTAGDRAIRARREINALAERGAWMMDRIRGLEGAQTGPAPRIRHRMELMEVATRDAQAAARDGD